MTVYSTTKWQENKAMLRDEWLVTNGFGSYAGTTTAGINTRKYHGLLIASFNPPVDRKLLVSKLDETIINDGQEYSLASNLVNDIGYQERKNNLEEIEETAFKRGTTAQTTENIKYSSQGYQNLLSFNDEELPTYTYQVNNTLVTKTVFLVYDSNTTVVKYRILDSGSKTKLSLKPLLNNRNHNQSQLKEDLNYQIVANKDKQLQLKYKDTALNIYWTAGEFELAEDYYEGMYYPFEKYRGETDLDDHYIPGALQVDISDKREFAVVFSTEYLAEINVEQWEEEYKRRQKKLIEQAPNVENDLQEQLVLAADKFIVERQSTAKKTILAGYPWFTDWGRDTMIALPGLALATGRYQEAKEILTTFALNLKKGLLPNVFDDQSGEPGKYNTIDGTLWFFYALKEYYDATADKEFIEKLYPKLEEIINYHQQGTLYDIQMDPADGLLTGGNSNVQLTWMDAKINDWVVTPRQGKAVEINALWYNALKIFNELGAELGFKAQNLDVIAKIESNFVDKFWYDEGGYLYDVIDDEEKDSSLRPNQVFVVSLPYSLLEPGQEKAVIDKIEEKLYTPVGLRSLSPEHEDYCGQYYGKRSIRDAAYHQGTVWAWLIGSYFEAYLKVNDFSRTVKNKVRQMYQPFAEQIECYGLGNISEVFDGDFPHQPRGCYAQAWSVAELLRVYNKYLAE